MKKDKNSYCEAENGEENRQKSNNELRKLAVDIFKGMVFTDRHVQIKEDVPRVFMPMALMGRQQVEDFQKKSPGLIYEYMDKALPKSINGMPMFLSFRFLSIEETKKVFDFYTKIIDAVEKVEEN